MLHARSSLMQTLKFEFMDGTRKCYTNVQNLQIRESSVIFEIQTSSNTIGKLIPIHTIKHLRSELN